MKLWSGGTERAESQRDSVRWAKPKLESRSRLERVEVKVVKVKVILVLTLMSTRRGTQIQRAYQELQITKNSESGRRYSKVEHESGPCGHKQKET